MNNRLKGESSPNGRIDRDSERKYDRRKRAEKETLRYYFSEEWFGNLNKNRNRKSTSEYQMSKCPVCKQVWNIYHDYKKVKHVKYWNNYQRLPMEKIICLNCINKDLK
jgi:phage FluMu protein Com|tara:strand:- start:2746 stop:3069 length:324 start_codon:yes stop_codon:yes gene_type:complete